MSIRINNYFKISDANYRQSFGEAPRNIVTELLSTAGAGTWTKPAGVTQVVVECWGAGGAGGGATTNNTGGGGGAGGAYARKTLTYTSPSVGISYTVGAGGTGGTGNGGNGGNTFWTTSDVLAVGGGGGQSGATQLPGAQALDTNCIGDFRYSGGIGVVGLGGIDGFTYRGAGGGAAGSTGPGGNGNGLAESAAESGGLGTGEFGGDGGDGINFGVNFTGQDGSIYGGGGSGGQRNDASRSGGNGARGLIRVTYELP